MAWWYRELIALPCGARYSMPLGVLGESPAFFRVFHGAGLAEYLREPLLLLAPTDPALFLYSLRHELEDMLEYDAGCPRIDPRLGSWFTCNPVLVGSSELYGLYECDRLRPLLLVPWTGYSRAYGCLVELLIYYTRVSAGVVDPDTGFTRGLALCLERSDKSGRLPSLAREILRDLL